MTYPELYMALQYNVYIIQFIKKNDESRIMLATRNINVCSMKYGFITNGMLSKRDERCDISNGNMAVIDLEIGEPRQFNIDSLTDIRGLAEFDASLAQLDSIEKIDRAIDVVKNLRSNGDKLW